MNKLFYYFRLGVSWFKTVFFRKYVKSKPKSKGELFIEGWLKNNKMKYYSQGYVYLDKIARNTKYVFIDFIVIHNGEKYFIEYNGKQHYEYTPFFHKGGVVDFEKQQRRDNLVREYCKDNDIILIEIPYTYSKSKIIKTLRRTFLNYEDK